MSNLTDRDASILAQVAFKAAAKAAPIKVSGLDIDATDFEVALGYYTQTLVDHVATTQTTYVAAQLGAQLGATEVPSNVTEGNFGGATVEVVQTKDGGQQGPLPAWFIKAAAEKGVTKVFDNRARLAENPKLPWFKSADEQKIPFWPPKD